MPTSGVRKDRSSQYSLSVRSTEIRWVRDRTGRRAVPVVSAGAARSSLNGGAGAKRAASVVALMRSSTLLIAEHQLSLAPCQALRRR